MTGIRSILALASVAVHVRETIRHTTGLSDSSYPAGACCLLLLLSVMTSPAQADIPDGLGLRLLAQLTPDLSQNQAISPFVISSLLTQIWLAAAGKTRKETNGAETGVMNQIYVRKGVSASSSFAQLVRIIYNCTIRQFASSSQAAAEINAEVARVTWGRIQQLVDSTSLEGLSVALVSALYFKDQWQWAFERRPELNFVTASGLKKVAMMEMRKELRYTRFDTFDAVEIPYKDNRHCMLLLRPLGRNMTAVGELKSKLDSLQPREILESMSTRDTIVTMPPLKLETTYSLRGALSRLGIRKLFTARAELPRFSGVAITASDLYHKVFLEVNEKGTEAAAAGAVILARSASRDQPVLFYLDRPFFAIVFNKRYNCNVFSAYVASP
ncbi:Serine proteinase inhibitor 2.4 [Amphibalanus amphitrite]|uniref:Serine proteinase inhibitor 2.4 n=1 Tax=Amphibalanus amphitrite TaxID=1232801 RepID=A0A6A4WHV9_AMPAM|nr:Serine proteinase inhibitor 2.4 [Amphibalanus amphitrite]